jgi:ferredoxin
VNENVCVGHGRCYVLGPDVFAADDYGHCVVLVGEVDDELLRQARLGAENCPEHAIELSQ